MYRFLRMMVALPTIALVLTISGTPTAAEELAEKVKKVEITVRTVTEEAATDRVPLVQVALLLDTSNSMDGLIRQAQDQLWAIVNELADKKRNGQTPRLQVALFEYGNNGLPATENYIRQIVPLTSDLDSISEALFELTTNGGSEYCGAVVEEAISVLNWTPGDDHYKAIFIAGNEPFTQGSVNYRASCSRAKAEGVLVNTIHCGNERDGIQGKWQHAAKIGGGDFLTINQDRAVRHIDCPQDAEILRLNIELNSTYIPYGDEGQVGARRQSAQDENAAGIAVETMARRAESKAKSNAYRNESWDLVDASESDADLLGELNEADLPSELRGKTVAEKQAMIATSSRERKEIQKRIAKLGAERADFLRQERAKAGADDSFGTAIQSLIENQAGAKGFH